MKECPDCLSKVSSRAKACPHCGYRETENAWILAIILVIIGFFAMAYNSVAGLLLWILAAILVK